MKKTIMLATIVAGFAVVFYFSFPLIYNLDDQDLPLRNMDCDYDFENKIADCVVTHEPYAGIDNVTDIPIGKINP